MRFAEGPTPTGWYVAHNVTIARAYLDHTDLATQENRVERFFINLVLMRLLYAHALVAAPRLALSRLAPTARWLGDPRRAMTGIFLSVSRVLPHVYPLDGELDDYIANEHTIGRLLDLGVIGPRIDQLYRWSADELQIPELAWARPRRRADVRLGSRRPAAVEPAHRHCSCVRCGARCRPPARTRETRQLAAAARPVRACGRCCARRRPRPGSLLSRSRSLHPAQTRKRTRSPSSSHHTASSPSSTRMLAPCERSPPSSVSP